MQKNDKLFHSRIFRIYLEYLRIALQWNEAQIDEFLADIQITRERLEDESSWFDAEFADNFYFRLRALTKDDELAYHAGIFVHQKTAGPVFHSLLRGLLDVTFVYRLVAKFSGYFSKAAEFNVVSAGISSAQVEVTPIADFDERPYMCENRRGTLSGVPLIFGLEAAEITESECIHKGGTKCAYRLKWQRTSQWVPIARNLMLVTSIAIFVWSWIGLIAALATFLSGSFAVGLILVERSFSQQKQELLNQNLALDLTLREVERKSRQIELVNQIAQLTHSRTSPAELSRTLVLSVCRILNYDRSMLLSVDHQRQVIQVAAHFGFDPQMKELLEQAEFNIRSENADGWFVRVVNTQAPVLVQDVPAQISKLSPRSQKFAKMLGSQSFVAVPLTDEHHEVVGILSVDNIKTSRKIDITDQDLLKTLSEHLGIAIHNAKLMRRLEENLEATNQFSQQQKMLRETFQKFVPSDIVSELSNLQSIDLSQKRLSLVKHRSVSILFLDIFNFSELSKKLWPEDVVDLLNTAFHIFEPVISTHRGFVDQFTGDGFLAIFEESESTTSVCHAASALIEALDEVNRMLEVKSYPRISIGIGINYGPVILGNIGSHNRLSFTVIGESVNLAARLESHTRNLGPNTICASASVRAKADPLLKWRELGMISLKGFTENVELFELIPHQSRARTAPHLVEEG